MPGEKENNHSKVDLEICLHLFNMPKYMLKRVLWFGDSVITSALTLSFSFEFIDYQTENRQESFC